MRGLDVSRMWRYMAPEGLAGGGGAIWGRVEKHTSFPNADLPDEVDSGNS